VEGIGAVQLDAARLGAEQAREPAEQGRLAGAVGTEQAEDLVLAQLEVDAPDRGAGAVPDDQPPRPQHRCHVWVDREGRAPARPSRMPPL
jgi:hypothetical protein